MLCRVYIFRGCITLMSAGISCLDRLYTLEVQLNPVEWFMPSLLFGYEEPCKCLTIMISICWGFSHDNDLFDEQRDYPDLELNDYFTLSSRYIITVGLLLRIRHSGSRTFLVPSDCKYRRTNVNYSSFCQDAACSVYTTGSNHTTAWANWLNFEFKK